MAAQKPKKNGGPEKPPENQNQVQPMLDDVLVALQKSFSRVSAKSAEVSPEHARAMISGQVNFEMSLSVDLHKDYLHPDTSGAVELKLSGTIDTDIRTVEEKPGDKESNSS